MSLLPLLNSRFAAALSAVGAPDAQPLVQAASRPEFGDYQMNGVMGAAKALKLNPRELAQKIIDAVDLAGIVSSMEIAGPGFINIKLDNAYLAAYVATALKDEHLGVAQSPAQHVMVEYSSVNLAKEMHVGHLRSTIIGDALARVQAFVGMKVTRQNHVGDWGTQFGMLVAYLIQVELNGDMERIQAAVRDEEKATRLKREEELMRKRIETRQKRGKEELNEKANTRLLEIQKEKETNSAKRNPYGLQLGDLEGFYRKAKSLFDTDEKFADLAREYVVRLQSGDQEIKLFWKIFVGTSLEHCDAIYRKLNVLLDHGDVRGESFYNADLPIIVDELREQGLLVESEGAQVVFLDEFKNKEGEPQASIIQKKDGGYLYTTTDLGAIRFRVRELKIDRCLYVVDARQALHFQQLFTIAKKAKFAPESVSLEHIAFGTMMGEDGKPFKTRSGDTIKLIELLKEAEVRAKAEVVKKYQDSIQKNKDSSRQVIMPSTEVLDEIANAVGIGAVKYADLSKSRTTDYIFNWNSMLSFEGNTAPYLQYAYTRVQSIFRKVSDYDQNAAIVLTESSEHALALELARFSDVVHAVAKDSQPHLLCAYLYSVATMFSRFYENCPVNQDGVTNASRLKVCDLTGKVLAAGLNLLGIKVLEAM